MAAVLTATIMINKGIRILSRWGAKKRPSSLFQGMLTHSAELSSVQEKGIFVTGVGRSGTHFMAELFSRSTTIKGYHMDDIGDAVGDSFTWYCKWYGLPVSSFEFVQSRQYLMQRARAEGSVFLESNPMIAFSLDDLAYSFDCRFVIMVRNPQHVVESHLHKGWYKTILGGEASGVPGYQYYLDRPNHSFSRIMPVTLEERTKWLGKTRSGKIAWMWRVTYDRIFQQLQPVTPDRYRVVILDDFNYQSYLDLAKFLGVTSIQESDFKEISGNKPGRGTPREKIQWDEQSKEEFNQEVHTAIVKHGNHGFTDRWLMR